MGKLAIISDLHADLNHLDDAALTQLSEVLQERGITRLHLAGDTGNKVTVLQDVLQFFEKQKLPVTFNFGNHEMPDLHGESAIEHFPDKHFLNLQGLPLNEEKVLVAFNGWYDYSYFTEKTTEQLRSVKNLYWYDQMIHRDADDLNINERILEELALLLERFKNKKVIIATHFVPRKEFIVYLTGKYQRFNEINAFLGSEKTGQLFDQYSNVERVIFGHTHRRFEDRRFGSTIYSCHPFGYQYEWQITRDFILLNSLAERFDPRQAQSIIREHQNDYSTYRKVHLKEEFRQAMTIIDY